MSQKFETKKVIKIKSSFKKQNTPRIEWNDIPKTIYMKIEKIRKYPSTNLKFPFSFLYIVQATTNLKDSWKTMKFYSTKHLQQLFERALVSELDENIYCVEYFGKLTYQDIENDWSYKKHTFKVSKVFIENSPDGDNIESHEVIEGSYLSEQEIEEIITKDEQRENFDKIPEISDIINSQSE